MMRNRWYSSSEQLLKSLRSYDNRRYGVTAIVATELRQSSLRSYDNHRYGVTAITATELRQSSLRSYGNHRYGVTTNAVTKQAWATVLRYRKQRHSDAWSTVTLCPNNSPDLCYLQWSLEYECTNKIVRKNTCYITNKGYPGDLLHVPAKGYFL